MINQQIYDDYINPRHSTAFSSPGNIKRHNKTYGRKDILETLNSVDSYTLHREFHKPRVRNPYFVYEKREQAQADLIDVSGLKEDNDDVTFLLVLIDVFTKLAWVEPLKRKTAEATLAGLRKILADMRQLPKSILFDRGKEFVNKRVTDFLIKSKIRIIHPNSEIKAGVAERFNRTLQDMLYRYLTENETFRYIDQLKNLVHAYNNRKHRTLKYITPTEAELEANKTWVLNAHNERFSKIVEKQKNPKYEIGQKVRIKKLNHRFQRGYHERFLREHFEIIQIMRKMPIPMYVIRSLNTHDIIRGAFYAEELQPISGDVFKIEKVIKKRKLKTGEEELFVKWQGYNDTHNSWVKASDITAEYG